MDPLTIIAMVVGVAASIGSYTQGKRSRVSEIATVADATVGMLSEQIATLSAREKEKGDLISSLTARIEMLESLVLQKTDLEGMKADIVLIKEKIGA